MKKNIVIVHYNTPLFTECLVRSINLFVKDAIIYIFDNSDKYPFVADFDNVLIIDNTKGEIIDFDKWLSSFKNKANSKNKWASAKHCYTVEKCMQIIKDNFILLDSDVLLKKDISCLYNDDFIYVGDIEQWKGNKRVIPYCCFINTKKCKENNIHFFNSNFIVGLTKNCNYDTGAYFYKSCKNFPSKTINHKEYIVHMDNGSQLYEKNNNAQRLFLSRNKELYIENKMVENVYKNKKVVYTCITGGYDNLIEPKFISEGFDYVCFTDNNELKSDVWKIKPLPKETEGLSQVKKQRYVKINPHLLLSEYDVSIWVDGNVTIKSDLNSFIDKFLTDECSIYVPKHPSRNCIYAESKAVISMNKDTKENVIPQIERYKKEGLPKDYGLLQSNIMLRKHNEKDCIRFMEQWFEELKNGSHRDQLSFNYVAWKNNDIKIFYLDKNIYKSQWFNWGASHKKPSKTSSRVTVLLNNKT